MPGKRSKSEERERKKRYRENRKPEKILLDQEKERTRMKQRKLQQTDEERKIGKDAARKAMKKYRAKFCHSGFESKNKETGYNEREENQKRMKRKRDTQTKEQNRENIKARERMATFRAGRIEEKKKMDKEKAKEGMKAFRAKQTDIDKELDQLEARERMEKLRLHKKDEDYDYEKIIKRQKIREKREKQSGKEHLIRNLQAKRGMQLINQEGTLRKFTRRERVRKKLETKDNTIEWKNYLQKGENHKRKLENINPDIVERINEQMRLDKEKERHVERDFNEGESAEWEDYCYILTKEEQKQVEQEEQREREATVTRIREEQKAKRLIKREELKRANAKPIDPLPERELCQYEKIREDIIRDRQEAMAKFGFFEDLNKTKEAIGFQAIKSLKKKD